MVDETADEARPCDPYQQVNDRWEEGQVELGFVTYVTGTLEQQAA
jgi:hypothetical protein